MPRKARIDAAGALHHIIVRGILSLRVRVGTTTRLKLLACAVNGQHGCLESARPENLAHRHNFCPQNPRPHREQWPGASTKAIGL